MSGSRPDQSDGRTAFYANQKSEEEAPHEIDFPKISKPPFSLAESFENSPRRTHLARAGGDTLPRSMSCPITPNVSSHSAFHSRDTSPVPSPAAPPCLPILILTFGSYTAEDHSILNAIAPYFTRLAAPSGTNLWSQGDRPDALYLIESGSLRATYAYDDHGGSVQETMVAGTIAGDLSLLSDTARNASVVVDREAILWRLDQAALESLERDQGEVARRFIQIVLKGESLSQRGSD